MRKDLRRKRLKKKYIPLLLLLPILAVILLLTFNFLNPEDSEPDISRPVVEEPEPIEEEQVEEQSIEEEAEEVTEQPQEDTEEDEQTDYESVTEVSVTVQTDPVKEEPKKEPGLLLTEATGTVFTIYSDTAQGSGFLYNSKGDIITNAHVVKGSYDVIVKNNTGQTLHGYVAGVSLKSDLALIRVPDLAGKQPMRVASTMAPINTEVTAIGSPNDKANTASTGKITDINVRIEDEYVYENLYEMTASIAPGSSGGPLFRNDTGEVIGINSIVGVGTDSTYGYAIPIHLVSGILAQFSKDADSIEEEGYEPPNNREDAYFSEELVTAFTSDFSELFYMYLSDETKNYYVYSFPENSPFLSVVENMRIELLAEASDFEYQANQIQAIEIMEDRAKVAMTLVYTGMVGEEQVVLERPVNLTIQIDEFGDYKITEIQ